MNDSRVLLRHTLATLAYRGGKVLRGASPAFAAFHASESTRTPVEILAHVGDLMDWACSIAKGKAVWTDATPLPWDAECARFFAGVKAFDDLLASDAVIEQPMEKLFQGPVADALTHIGQIAILRRLAGEPVKGENYFVAAIETGRVGADQAAPRKEF